MMLLAVAMPAIPAGGNIVATMDGTLETPSFELRCSGRGARIPEGLPDMLAGKTAAVDPRSVMQ